MHVKVAGLQIAFPSLSVVAFQLWMSVCILASYIILTCLAICLFRYILSKIMKCLECVEYMTKFFNFQFGFLMCILSAVIHYIILLQKSPHQSSNRASFHRHMQLIFHRISVIFFSRIKSISFVSSPN